MGLESMPAAFIAIGTIVVLATAGAVATTRAIHWYRKIGSESGSRSKLQWDRRVQTNLLIFGVIETGGAMVWCAAGAGIYGSPLGGMRGDEFVHVSTFLLVGPLSVLPAATAALWKPIWGAVWLIVGGLVSGAVAVRYFSSDAGILPLGIASLPMLIAGLSLLRLPNMVAPTKTREENARLPSGQGNYRRKASRVSLARSDRLGGQDKHSSLHGISQRQSAVDSLGGSTQPPRIVECRPRPHGRKGQGAASPWFGVFIFLVGWIGAFFGLIALATIFRETVLSHKLPSESNGIALLISIVVVGVTNVVKKKLDLPIELIIGMWIAMLSGLIVIALN